MTILNMSLIVQLNKLPVNPYKHPKWLVEIPDFHFSGTRRNNYIHKKIEPSMEYTFQIRNKMKNHDYKRNA